MIYGFGDCELETEHYALRRAGKPLKVEPKVFDVRSYLIAHCHRIVPHEELLKELWPGQFVSDGVLSSCIKKARQAIGDNGQAQRMIQTVCGYGFVAYTQERRPGAERPVVPPEAGAIMPRAPAVCPSPWVGRAQVLRQLHDCLAQAARGQAQVSDSLVPLG